MPIEHLDMSTLSICHRHIPCYMYINKYNNCDTGTLLRCEEVWYILKMPQNTHGKSSTNVSKNVGWSQMYVNKNASIFFIHYTHYSAD
jgi:hypothetical protein